jgi:hypothetical protein
LDTRKSNIEPEGNNGNTIKKDFDWSESKIWLVKPFIISTLSYPKERTGEYFRMGCLRTLNTHEK